MCGLTTTERRVLVERRRKPTSPLTLSGLKGSRKAVRRKAEASGQYYVDCYSRYHLAWLSLCLLLSVADGFLTLHLLDLGAVELNPVMRYVLGFGPLSFLLIKYFLTAFGFIWLLIHKQHFLPSLQIKVCSLFIALLCLYAGVVLYELVQAFSSPLETLPRAYLLGVFL